VAAHSEGRTTARNCCRDTETQVHTELPPLMGHHFRIWWRFKPTYGLGRFLECYLAYTQIHIAVAYTGCSKTHPGDQVTVPENVTAAMELRTLRKVPQNLGNAQAAHKTPLPWPWIRSRATTKSGNAATVRSEMPPRRTTKTTLPAAVLRQRWRAAQVSHRVCWDFRQTALHRHTQNKNKGGCAEIYLASRKFGAKRRKNPDFPELLHNAGSFPPPGEYPPDNRTHLQRRSILTASAEGSAGGTSPAHRSCTPGQSLFTESAGLSSPPAFCREHQRVPSTRKHVPSAHKISSKQHVQLLSNCQESSGKYLNIFSNFWLFHKTFTNHHEEI